MSIATLFYKCRLYKKAPALWNQIRVNSNQQEQKTISRSRKQLAGAENDLQEQKLFCIRKALYYANYF